MTRSVREFSRAGKELHPEVLAQRQKTSGVHDALDGVKATLGKHGIGWSKFANHLANNMPGTKNERNKAAIDMHENDPVAFDKFIEPLKR